MRTTLAEHATNCRGNDAGPDEQEVGLNNPVGLDNPRRQREPHNEREDDNRHRTGRSRLARRQGVRGVRDDLRRLIR